MVHVKVTTTYLEQLSPSDVRPARASSTDVEIRPAEIPSPELSRFLYASVGGDWYWLDRLSWTWSQWQEWLSRPGVETWIAYVRGTPAGYAELDPQPDGVVELAYFGLLPAFLGQGVGGRLLTEALQHAWTLAERWPGQPPTTRVWVHTCTLDGPAALGNYEARGLTVFRTTTEEVELPSTPPGPWPGADRPTA